MDGELERYRMEQADAWLSKVRRAVRYARSLEDAVEAQYAIADNLRAIDYSAEPVSKTPVVDAIPKAVANHMEAADALEAITRDAKERIVQASAAISSMDNPIESMCLLLYYVDDGSGKPADMWEGVCVKMSYSYDGMMKLRRRALLHAYDVMPHVERDEMPPAL